MTVRDAMQKMTLEIQAVYDEREARTLADWAMENVTGKKRIDRMMDNEAILSDEQEARLRAISTRLLAHEPVQYILKEAWFHGLKVYVDKNVLIPRPETEELVDWVLRDSQAWILPGDRNMKIMDVGTGSGCIAITLRKNLPGNVEVWACDKSDAVLTIARKNADDHQALVDFVPLDFLSEMQRKQLPHIDIIISNPPYIPLAGKSEMADNVVKHEPALALYVPDDDPLVFYKAIADFGLENLYPGGKIYVEIHEEMGEQVIALFTSKKYSSIELKKDMQGRDRMVKASLDVDSNGIALS